MCHENLKYIDTYLKKYSELFQLVEYLSVIVTMMFTLLHHFEEQALIFKNYLHTWF